MFTGIIETKARVKEIASEGSNLKFTIASNLASDLSVEQSVSHDGVCLTVVNVGPDWYQVIAIEETLQKSALRMLVPGSFVNLERSMPVNGRFDGHIVQGHVDTTAYCESIELKDGSWIMNFRLTSETRLLVEKGSVTVNGVSLTCFNVKPKQFSVAIIPYTYEHTNLSNLTVEGLVNVEFDIVGKYVQSILNKSNS